MKSLRVPVSLFSGHNCDIDVVVSPDKCPTDGLRRRGLLIKSCDNPGLAKKSRLLVNQQVGLLTATKTLQLLWLSGIGLYEFHGSSVSGHRLHVRAD